MRTEGFDDDKRVATVAACCTHPARKEGFEDSVFRI